ncbi:hypothetical protein ACVXHB_10980 [Escherichia coli]
MSSFTAYTFIALILTQVTGVTGATVSLFMLVYGITAAVRYILGGNLPTAWGLIVPVYSSLAALLLSCLVCGCCHLTGEHGHWVALLGMGDICRSAGTAGPSDRCR